MKRVAVLFGFAAACGAMPGLALDIDPGSRAKAVATAAASGAVVGPAPVALHDPLPELLQGVDVNGRGISGACALKSTDLCYDYKENRLIYRPSRNWMPEIGGLTPEYISVRRNSVVFKYSFK